MKIPHWIKHPRAAWRQYATTNRTLHRELLEAQAIAADLHQIAQDAHRCKANIARELMVSQIELRLTRLGAADERRLNVSLKARVSQLEAQVRVTRNQDPITPSRLSHTAHSSN